jgi:hypothetical protein
MFTGLNFNLPNHQEAESGYSDLSNSVCGMWARLDRVGGIENQTIKQLG